MLTALYAATPEPGWIEGPLGHLIYAGVLGFMVYVVVSNIFPRRTS